MAENDQPQDVAPKARKSRLPLILGGVLAILGGGAGFYATYAGMILGGHKAAASAHGDDVAALPDIAFVPVAPMVISLGPASRNSHLRFTAQLEVDAKHSAEVTLLLPRIMDVLNGYLRAIDVAEIEDPGALVRMRAHMLRRAQIVSGEGRVRDLLVTEFVLN
jgi:flagellar protein FliL